MIFAPDPQLREDALQALRDEYKMDVTRPGLHQSALANCLTKAYFDKTAFLPPSNRQVGIFVVGFAFERVLLAREMDRPESFEVDGITLSLDTKNLFGPADLKTTRKSENGRKGEDGFQPSSSWPIQFKSYRYGLNRTGDVGYDFGVIVLHLISGEVTAWRYVFTQQELEENWDWLLSRKRQLEWMLAHEDPQPFQHNAKTDKWSECDDCVYALKCGLLASLQGLQKPSNVLALQDYK